MADAPDLREAIANSANGPRSVDVQGMGRSEEHSLSDQIKAAKFLPPSSVRKRVGGGMKFTKATAGGAVE